MWEINVCYLSQLVYVILLWKPTWVKTGQYCSGLDNYIETTLISWCFAFLSHAAVQCGSSILLQAVIRDPRHLYHVALPSRALETSTGVFSCSQKILEAISGSDTCPFCSYSMGIFVLCSCANWKMQFKSMLKVKETRILVKKSAICGDQIKCFRFTCPSTKEPLSFLLFLPSFFLSFSPSLPPYFLLFLSTSLPLFHSSFLLPFLPSLVVHSLICLAWSLDMMKTKC